jgi:glutamine amidotransferase
MCELFAMSSRVPATVSLSLEEFSRHGGLTDKHKDGWGIAYYHDRDALLIREPGAASNSAYMQFVKSGAFSSTLVISHIRRATIGAVALRNTQPFARELAGRLHVFAHNGMLSATLGKNRPVPGCFHPIGDTDSEYAFCLLMDQLSRIWTDPGKPPSLDDRMGVVAEFARYVGALGPANFIYCDGEVMIVHGNRRSHPDGIHPPGLYYLCRRCSSESTLAEITGLDIESDNAVQDIVLLASVPLSDEKWMPLQEGELLLLKEGRIADRS